jgi:arabinan endo-1,5-alpha-L-arabinosidase
MSRSKLSFLFSFGLLLGSAALVTPALAATSGQNGTHDPSRMIESDGKFYVYSTGGGSKSSPDGLAWTNGPALFPNGYPSWVKSTIPNDEGIWAPDGIYFNGQYFLFYSVANTTNACALGVMTSPTLDPSSSKFHWTDHGVVVSNTGSATYCVIDPAPVVDADNNLWVVWGSGYSHPSTSDTIFVTRLDNTTGLPSSADTTKPGHPLSKGHEEGGYMYFHDGYYYLWYNTGGCCDGAKSTYVIHVTRSQKITGPFSGDRVFMSSSGSVHGPGHMGIYNDCGYSRFTYHYYPDTGGSVLGENELSWGGDGWPVVGAASTQPMKACLGSGGSAGSAGSGGAGGGVSNGGASAAGAAQAGSGGELGSLGGSGGSIDSGVSGGGSVGAGATGVAGALAAGATGVGTAGRAGSDGDPSPGSDGGGASSDSGCSFRALPNGDSSATWLIAAGALALQLRRRRAATRSRSA